MFLGFLIAGIAIASPPVGGEGALARTGDVLGDAVVTGVEVHPEYERYALRDGKGRVAVAELTTGAGGLCDVGALTIFPRADLSGVNETVGMAELCERLEARRPRLRARTGDGAGAGGVTDGGRGPEEDRSAPPMQDGGSGAPRSPGAVDANAPTRLTPLHLALVLLVVLAVPRLRVDRLLAGVTVVSLVVRLLASPRGIGLPIGTLTANLAIAVLAAPLLAALVRREVDARAGLAAGLLFALLPAHVGVSATESMHVSVVTLELLAMLAASAFARGGGASLGAIAALATGIAVNLRPDALPFVLVPIACVVAGVRAGALPLARCAIPGALLAGLVGWRAATLEGTPGGMYAAFTPPVLWGLALIGIAVLWRTGRRAPLGILLLWIALTTIPVAAKVWPAVDALRLPLAGQTPWVALAGVGAAALAGVVGRWVLPVALLTMIPYLAVRP